MSPNMPSYQGRTALVEFIESFGITEMTKHTIVFTEVDGYGDMAYARGAYDEAYSLEGVDDPIEEVGKLLAVLRKQADGSWLIANWITNSDLPLPSMEGEHSEGGEHR